VSPPIRRGGVAAAAAAFGFAMNALPQKSHFVISPLGGSSLVRTGVFFPQWVHSTAIIGARHLSST
jgi:hypothetical protein